MEYEFLPKRKEYLSLLEKAHENFASEFLYGDRQEALRLLDCIKPDYDKCWFLNVAIGHRNYEMLELLLERNPKKGIEKALSNAVARKDQRAAKLLIDYGVDIESFKGDDDYCWLEKISRT